MSMPTYRGGFRLVISPGLTARGGGRRNKTSGHILGRLNIHPLL